MNDYHCLPLDYQPFDDATGSINSLSHAIAKRFLGSSSGLARNARKAQKAISIVISNLYYAYILSTLGRSCCVRYSRSKEAYKGLNPGYDAMVGAIDWLEESGFCSSVRGFYDRRTNIGRLSRMRYTQKLANRFNALKVVSPLLKTTDHLFRFKEEGTKALRPVCDAVDAIFEQAVGGKPSCREKLIAINTVRRSCEVRRGHTLLPNRDYYRVFNNESFGAGGRFYGDVLQSLPSKKRSEVTFNGEATVELDFGGLHPQLLYDINGVPVKGDPYDIEGFDRKVVKQAFQRVLNNRNVRSALLSVNKFLREDHPEKQVSGKCLVDAIMSKHQAVLPSQSDACLGLLLQRVDSEIALEVMYHFAAKDIPCAGIHDSFIVPQQYEKELKCVMVDKYNEVVRMEFVRQYERRHKKPCPESIWRNLQFSPIVR